jgi:polyvinyl alcohol dehydrogenase (cytochrome)
MKIPAISLFSCVVGILCATSIAAGQGIERAVADTGARMARVRQGNEIFKERCAGCHEPATNRAPDKAQLESRSPDQIQHALKEGVMQPMTVGLTDADIGAVVAYLAHESASRPEGDPPRCASSPAFSLSQPGWNGWSIDARNDRFQPRPRLSAADLPKLKVKWSMAYVGGRYGQPTVAGGRLFLTSSSGRIYALDPKIGCMYWRFDADAGVRTTPLVGRIEGATASGYVMYFGDFSRQVYALDPRDGTLIWKSEAESHPRGALTGAFALYQNTLYVPLSSSEEALGGVGSYGCCTHRGGVAALEAGSGRHLWTTYAIDTEPHSTIRNASGVQQYGPAGASVWSAPTIDARRGVLYIGSGDSFTDVEENGSDAIIAIDLESGAVRWRQQMTVHDTFLVGCTQPGTINCPAKLGPDHDFGASPMLLSLAGGRDILVAGQKSGIAYGLDPDARGKPLWRKPLGNGGWLGGIEWGMAADSRRIYIPISDAGNLPPDNHSGLMALDPRTGSQFWYQRAPQVECHFTGRCFNAQSAAPSAIPGVVLSSTMDGHVRAYLADSGRIVWDFDSAAQTYQTINGVKDQHGGSLDVASPIVVDGMLFFISGYSGPLGGVPNNVVLALAPDDR